MTDLSPRLIDVRISLDLITRYGRAGHLSDEAFRALTSLVATCAAGLCWTYKEPSDGSLPDDDDILRQYAITTKRRWLKVRPDVEQFFTVAKGRWHLAEEWVAIDDRPLRVAIPLVIQQQVLSRQGRVCTYCGDTEGPFDFDHIFPVSRGGTNDPSNLTLACSSCNRSKGARTLREWVGR